MSVHSATGHDLYLIGLICCEITMGTSQCKHIFIACKNLQKELVISLYMKQLHHSGCNWTVTV